MGNGKFESVLCGEMEKNYLITKNLNISTAPNITAPPPHVIKNSNNTIVPKRNSSNGIANPMVITIPVNNQANVPPNSV